MITVMTAIVVIALARGLPRAGGQRGAERFPVGDRRRLTSDDCDSGGSSVAEFALVLVLLLMLFLALVSVGLWAYTRTAAHLCRRRRGPRGRQLRRRRGR